MLVTCKLTLHLLSLGSQNKMIEFGTKYVITRLHYVMLQHPQVRDHLSSEEISKVLIPDFRHKYPKYWFLIFLRNIQSIDSWFASEISKVLIPDFPQFLTLAWRYDAVKRVATASTHVAITNYLSFNATDQQLLFWPVFVSKLWK
jgi:hypothetical protein